MQITVSSRHLSSVDFGICSVLQRRAASNSTVAAELHPDTQIMYTCEMHACTFCTCQEEHNSAAYACFSACAYPWPSTTHRSWLKPSLKTTRNASTNTVSFEAL
jgi:hypothetical protein